MSGIRQAKPEEIKSHFESDDDFLMIDVRGQDEFDSISVPGAKLIPLPVFSVELVEKAGGSKDKTIYILCRSGARSMVAASKLIDAGFKDVVNIQGGINLWQQSGLEVKN